MTTAAKESPPPAPPAAAVFAAFKSIPDLRVYDAAEAARAPKIPVSDMAAALMAAHCTVDLGRDRVSKMTARDAHAWVLSMRFRFPRVWFAFSLGSPLKLVKSLDMCGVPHATRQEYEATMTAILARPKVQDLDAAPSKPTAAPAVA
jgi:hypothetical protein